MSTETGKVIQVIGPWSTWSFPRGICPTFITRSRLRVDADSQTGQSAAELTMEVAQHLGENRVRAVSMSSTDGLGARAGSPGYGWAHLGSRRP